MNLYNDLFSIYHPPRPSPHGSVIIYLPRGPLASPETNHLPSLALSSNSIIVRLNYRLSTQVPFPTPIHDVLAGYDWVREHLSMGTARLEDTSDLSGLAKLGVCGEFIGGSLASMLALTECHSTKHGIIAGAIGNPIADWTSLSFEGRGADAIHARSASGSGSVLKELHASVALTSSEHLTVNSLISLREKIFPKEETFFDPFASPSLFFRTPSFDLPPPTQRFSFMDPTSNRESEDDTSPALVKKRRSHRKYPPLSSGLRIPRMRFEVGQKNVWKNQGLELAELTRRSVDLWENEEQQESSHMHGKNRIDLVHRTESGLWGDKEIVEIGYWFAEVFR